MHLAILSQKLTPVSLQHLAATTHQVNLVIASGIKVMIACNACTEAYHIDLKTVLQLII